jgi:3'-5' exoribonuclease
MKATLPMARRYVNELRDGDSVEETYLLADKQLRANRNANLYLLTQLRDRTGLVSGLMWNVTEDAVSHISAGDYVKVKGKVQLYQGALQMIVTQMQPVSTESLDLDDFQAQPGQNIEELLERLRGILLSIDDPHLCTLMECFLVDEGIMSDLSRAPAGVRTHHAYHGGLLEHVVNILETAHRIGDLYPSVDLNLLLAGIFLHDLGKIRELSYDTNFLYTDEGQLLGHLVIAISMLDEKIAQTAREMGEPFPQEIALRLKHMILSHHGTYAFGSPKLPMTPEAVALHYLDNLDAKIHEFSRDIEDDPNSESSWTPYNPRLERKLFKGARSQAEETQEGTPTE